MHITTPLTVALRGGLTLRLSAPGHEPRTLVASIFNSRADSFCSAPTRWLRVGTATFALASPEQHAAAADWLLENRRGIEQIEHIAIEDQRYVTPVT